jgi:hypothetical protein
MSGKKRSVNCERRTNTGLLKIPSRLGRLFEDYICHITGKETLDLKVLEKIRQSVIVQKSGYWSLKPAGRYGRSYDVFAYLAYQVPGYLIQLNYILKRIEEEGLMPDDISLLDLGSGPGTVPLAVIWYQKERKRGSLTIHAIEKSEEFLKAFNFLVPAFINKSSNIKLGVIKCADIRTPSEELPKTLNLIILQNVLAEMSDLSFKELTEILLEYAKKLSEDGFLIIIEPAEFRHSTRLRNLQVELIKAGLFVHAPCRYIRSNSCNPGECWSFCSLPSIEPPRLMQRLAGEKEAYRFLNTDVKFSYLICSKTQSSDKSDYYVPKDTTPLSYLKGRQGTYINVIIGKMSEDIGNKEYAVFLICDGTGLNKTYLVIPRRSSDKNLQIMSSADYGSILIINNIRVRWNPKKQANNLISGSGTRINRVCVTKR